MKSAASSLPTEIKVGSLVFEYDGRREMYVGHEEEVGGMIENVWPEDWASFVNAVFSDGVDPEAEARRAI